MAGFLTHSENIDRAAGVYNMAASLLNSFQSVIFLMVLTRVAGTEEAGMFTIAFAYSNMFLTVAKYGMRHYQASDRHEEFSFRQYVISRALSCIGMLVIGAVCIGATAAANGYSDRKCGIMLWMLLLRLPDAIEDVWYGRYQQRGRLDVAAKAMTVRMVWEIAVYLLLTVTTKDQYKAVVGTSVLNLAALVYVLHATSGVFGPAEAGRDEENRNGKNDRNGRNNRNNRDNRNDRNDRSREDIAGALRLLRNCCPLFLGSFLTIYVTNAPKYAIDAILSDEEQAYYGYLSMPVSMIGLLGGFLFIPMLYEFTRLWDEGALAVFRKRCVRIAGMVAGITGACLAAAFAAGIPVLSLLFHADLSAHRGDLLILLAGGGFSALAAFLNAIVTVMRRQKELLFGYAATAVLAALVSNETVRLAGMRGASLLFAGLMAVQCGCFAAVMMRGMRKRAAASSRAT